MVASNSNYILKSEDYYRNFKESIKAKDTLVSYDRTLKVYMKYMGFGQDEYSLLIEGKDTRIIEADLAGFIVSLKKRNYSLASQQLYLSALVHFYSINDIMLNRKKISKFMSNDDMPNSHFENFVTNDNSDNDAAAGDKPYTHQQIARLLDFSDLRTKTMILLMSSSGMRVGALPWLRVGDLIPIPKYRIYQIRVYANSKSKRYHTFCTPECRKAIDNYLEFRRSYGENITPKSSLLRREFDKQDVFAVANDVRPATRHVIREALSKTLYASGIRTPIAEKANHELLNYRRDIAMSHGFRKFFDTNCTHSGMNPIYIEFCQGHSLKGVKDSYFLPQPDSNGVYVDILEGNDKSLGYIQAIDYLTINDEDRLRRENEMLKIKKSEIEQLKEQVAEYKNIQPMFENFQREINNLKTHLNEEAEKRRNNKRSNNR